jgi:hypothetical protein
VIIDVRQAEPHFVRPMSVQVDHIDEQVESILSALKYTANWRTNIVRTINEVLCEQNLERRLSEIRVTNAESTCLGYRLIVPICMLNYRKDC